MGKKCSCSLLFCLRSTISFIFEEKFLILMCPLNKDIPRRFYESLLTHKIMQSNRQCKGNLIHEYGRKFKSSITEASSSLWLLISELRKLTTLIWGFPKALSGKGGQTNHGTPNAFLRNNGIFQTFTQHYDFSSRAWLLLPECCPLIA